MSGLRRAAGDEQGVAIVWVALSMIVIMGVAALVVDLGNGWRTRRALVPATDAAALAAAQDYVNQDVATACTSTADSFLAANEAAATMVSCVPHFYGSGHGRVTVTATHDVNTWFAPIIGQGDYTVPSVSTAVWGSPLTVTGMRPIGLCLQSHTDLQTLVNNPPPPDTTVPLTIVYNKDQPDDCGNVPGNWGTVDFENANNSDSTLAEWIMYGYPGDVAFDDDLPANPPPGSCAGEVHCHQGNTGAVASQIRTALEYLDDNDIIFTLPVFDFSEGNGANARLHLMGYIRVELIDFHVTGNPAGRFFDLEVSSGLITGTCCGPPGGANSNKVIAICGVDPGAYAACDP